MTKKRITGKHVLLAVLVILLLGVAHYSGGVLGFFQGYHASMVQAGFRRFCHISRTDQAQEP